MSKQTIKKSSPKIKFPMDMTEHEHKALGEAAQKFKKNKKQLIYDALKKAYGIDLEAANKIPQL